LGQIKLRGGARDATQAGCGLESLKAKKLGKGAPAAFHGGRRAYIPICNELI
jgi:hypothetical protein